MIAAYHGGVFACGERDCFHFPLDAAEAVTGRDIRAAAPSYRSPFWAAVELRRKAFRGVGDAFASAFPEISPSRASRGDIGVVIESGAESGVVVLGAQVIGIAQAGLTILPRSRLSRAFRVE